MNELLVSTAAAGRRIGGKPATVRRMVTDGRLGGVKSCGRVRVTVSSLEAFVSGHTTGTSEPKSRHDLAKLMRRVLMELRVLRRELAKERR